ncbi:hypothetical protein [Nocardiopsis ansamitocini]|uniref:Uncharacterized protein n=1 Tax=Nocardiopsis ansamitocini TaxID=1670832 RepID=A0A9W6UG08_9ACTN|nr:hypothetical protein [Nocardiopsis ansamitocini]GLU46306.1 hypothetical protein Nans01_06570 [Nocardiopsis ansamitocini]
MVEREVPRLRALRTDYDKARAALMQGIREELEARGGQGLNVIARSVDWSPQYIGKIRDGKVGD